MEIMAVNDLVPAENLLNEKDPAALPRGKMGVDVVFECTKRPTPVEEVNAVFREEARAERYNGILGVTDDPIVSSDIIQDSRASLVDAEMTQVVDGDLVKVISWYDNEWGYSNQMVRVAVEFLKLSEKV